MSEIEKIKTNEDFGMSGGKDSLEVKPSACDGLGDVFIDLSSPNDEFSSSDGSVSSVVTSCCGDLEDSRWLAFKKLLDAHDKLANAFLVMLSEEEKD